jgi:hypothetical protein
VNASELWAVDPGYRKESAVIRTRKDFPSRRSSALLLIVQHYLRHRLAGNDCRAGATRDFRSRHVDTFLPKFVVLWQ